MEMDIAFKVDGGVRPMIPLAYCELLVIRKMQFGRLKSHTYTAQSDSGILVTGDKFGMNLG